MAVIQQQHQNKTSFDKILGQLTFLDLAISAWRRDCSNTEMLSQAVRTMQSVRGICRGRGYPEMELLACELEDLLNQIRNGGVAVNDDVIHALRNGSDALESSATAGELDLPLPVEVGDARAELHRLLAGLMPTSDCVTCS